MNAIKLNRHDFDNFHGFSSVAPLAKSENWENLNVGTPSTNATTDAIKISNQYINFSINLSTSLHYARVYE